MRVSSARTSKDLNFFFVCQVVLFVGILVCLLAIWLTKMLANTPKCWQTNQNAGKQTKILTNKPKFWHTNQNSSKQTKFVCQNFGLFFKIIILYWKLFFNWGGIMPQRTQDKEVRPNILKIEAVKSSLNLSSKVHKN